MPKFYGRNGGVRLSQMPFNHRVGDEPLKDILIIDNVGDRKYFSIKVYARDSDHAQRIMMGVIRTVYPGILITDCPFLFVEAETEGYKLVDFSCRAKLSHNGYYDVIGNGLLYYYSRGALRC